MHYAKKMQTKSIFVCFFLLGILIVFSQDAKCQQNLNENDPKATIVSSTVFLEEQEQQNDVSKMTADQILLAKQTFEQSQKLFPEKFKQKKYETLELARLKEKKLHPNQKHYFNVQFDSKKRLNLNLFSSQVHFGFIYRVFQGNEIKQQQMSAFQESIQNFPQLDYKISKNSDFKHFMAIQAEKQLYKSSQSNHDFHNFLFMIKIVPNTSFLGQIDLKKQNHTFCINFLIFQENIQVLSEFQYGKPMQFALLQDQRQRIELNYSKSSFSGQKKPQKKSKLSKPFLQIQLAPELIFHNVHLVGDFSYTVSLQGQFYDQKARLIEKTDIVLQQNYQESSFILEKDIIEVQIQKLQKKRRKNRVAFGNRHIKIIIDITCLSSICNFISEVEKSYTRSLIPGVPHLYSIKDFQIFQISNPLDLQFEVQVSKKSGYPLYKICSIKEGQSSDDNTCIQDLSIQHQFVYSFEAKQQEEKINIFGKTFQLRIDSQHPSYCYLCKYYIGLYSDYYEGQGTILVKNLNAQVLIPQGHSVSQIIHRGKSEQYLFYGRQTLIQFEKIAGKVDIQSASNIDSENMYGLNNFQVHLQKLNLQILDKAQYTSTEIRNQINRSLKGKIVQNKKKTNKSYYTKIKVSTSGNYPSSLYEIVAINSQSRKIMLRDGVPHLNRQTEKTSIFKYQTEKIQTVNFGTIIINSEKIQNIDLSIKGVCLKKAYQTASSYSKYLLRSQAIVPKQSEKYQTVAISNQKVNLMANRIDILIQPDKCKSYEVQVHNKKYKKQQNRLENTIDYQVLVSFIDSIILPLNTQIPGILRYPGKLIQIYEIFMTEKTQLSIGINFCRAGKGRLHFYQRIEALLQENADKEVKFSSDSQLQETNYLAHPGMLYLSIQFLGFSSILEYTLLIRETEVKAGFYYTDLSATQKQISFKVKQVGFSQTVYDIFFSPIFLKHWDQRVQSDVQEFTTQYFILESNSYPLINRAASCKGQFFSDIINHHEHFKQVKIDKQFLTWFDASKSGADNIQSGFIKYDRGFYRYEYKTVNPLSFLIIVPVISKFVHSHSPHSSQSINMIHQDLLNTKIKQSVIIPYWKFNSKSRQPYQITQLHNGKFYSMLQHLLLSWLIYWEQIWDFHFLEQTILILLGIFLGIPCAICILVFLCKIKKYIISIAAKGLRCMQKKTQVQNIPSYSHERSDEQQLREQHTSSFSSSGRMMTVMTTTNHSQKQLSQSNRSRSISGQLEPQQDQEQQLGATSQQQQEIQYQQQVKQQLNRPIVVGSQTENEEDKSSSYQIRKAHGSQSEEQLKIIEIVVQQQVNLNSSNQIPKAQTE